MLLEVMATAAVNEVPAKWVASIKQCLRGSNPEIARQAIRVVQARNLNSCRETLEAILADPTQKGELHVAALAAVAPFVFWLTNDQFTFLLAQLKDDAPLTRFAAAEAISRFRTKTDQRLALCKILPNATALELPYLVTAFEHHGTQAVGEKLIAALQKSPALTTLTPQQLRTTFE